jgi:hypothetical protein
MEPEFEWGLVQMKKNTGALYKRKKTKSQAMALSTSGNCE